MSVESCKKFLQATQDRPEIKQRLKAATGMAEIVALGGRNGFDFTTQDLVQGSMSFDGPRQEESENGTPHTEDRHQTGSTTFYHHEYELAEVPGLDALIDELPHLKLAPPSVDLKEFHVQFRERDLMSTSDSPADPNFQDWHRRMAASQWRDTSLDDPPRRDFHLINLDEHVEHPGYAAYFEAKTRVVDLLEDFFEDEIRFSGSLWYPPSSYRLWHTNENQPGWRMYVVDLDDEFTDPEDTSFFRYMKPDSGEIVTLRERRKIVRFFKTEQDADKLFWHCIVNPTVRNRWSFGFVVPDTWKQRIERS